MRKTVIPIAVAASLIGSAAYAQGVRAVRSLPGYVCMGIDLSEDRMLEVANLPHVLQEPSAAAPQIGIVGTIAFAKSPAHIVNGFAEVIMPSGQSGWVSASALIPYRSASDPHARCVPSVMENGRIGIGIG